MASPRFKRQRNSKYKFIISNKVRALSSSGGGAMSGPKRTSVWLVVITNSTQRTTRQIIEMFCAFMNVNRERHRFPPGVTDIFQEANKLGNPMFRIY